MNQKKELARLLRKALLQGGEMQQSLYEYELEEIIDDLYKGLKVDGEDYVFAITENTGHVAMVLITGDKTVYKNEAARDKLAELWPAVYEKNIKLFMPMWIQNLADGYMAIQGVKTVDSQKQPPSTGRVDRGRIWQKRPE